MQAHARTALGKSSRNTPSLSPRHSDLSVKKKTQFTVVWPCHWTALLLEHRDLTPSQAAGTPTCPAEGPSGVQAHVPPTAHWEEVADHPRGPQGTGQEGHSISQMNMLRPGGCQGPAQGVEDRRLGPLQQDGVTKAFQAANTHSWGRLDMLGLEGPPQPQPEPGPGQTLATRLCTPGTSAPRH